MRCTCTRLHPSDQLPCHVHVSPRNVLHVEQGLEIVSTLIVRTFVSNIKRNVRVHASPT